MGKLVDGCGSWLGVCNVGSIPTTPERPAPVSQFKIVG